MVVKINNLYYGLWGKFGSKRQANYSIEHKLKGYDYLLQHGKENDIDVFTVYYLMHNQKYAKSLYMQGC